MNKKPGVFKPEVPEFYLNHMEWLSVLRLSMLDSVRMPRIGQQTVSDLFGQIFIPDISSIHFIKQVAQLTSPKSRAKVSNETRAGSHACVAVLRVLKVLYWHRVQEHFQLIQDLGDNGDKLHNVGNMRLDNGKLRSRG